MTVQLTLDHLTQSTETLEPGSVNTCWLTDVLCWERYGYDGPGGAPAYASDLLTVAKRAATIAQPADYRMDITVTHEGYKWGAKYRFYDPANPWASAWESAVGQCVSESSARQYAENEFTKHRGYHEGTINALIQYRETGTPDKAGYLNDSHRYWLKKDYNPAKVVYLKEHQPGVICYEKFDNPDYPHLPGYIHVEIRAHKVDEWFVDCEGNSPDRERKGIGATFIGTTYEEARRLGEKWITEVARPFIAQRTANRKPA